MQEAILHIVRSHALIPAESLVIVGVSGGADSLALLHVLHQLSPYLRYRLHAATFNHGLRGEAGAEDVRFVRHTAEAWGIPVTDGAADVRELARREKMSIEAAARRARYDFLADVARQTGAARVAVGHHAGDQAETVLLHLLRGAGIGGLAGMAFQSLLPGHPDLHLIRPLLNITRAEIEAYCRANNLHPRQDITNADVTYLRNRLRHETLPHLQTLNPQITRVLAQLADIAAVENDYAEGQLKPILDGATRDSGERVSLDRDTFMRLHPALARRFVAWAAGQVAGSKQDIEYKHIVAAVAVARRGRLGAAAELPGGLRLRVDYKTIIIERAAAPLPETNIPLLDDGAEIPVSIPGMTPVSSQWALIVSLESPNTAPPLPEAEGSGLRAVLTIPEGSTVTLRTRRDGDRFAPPGLNGHTQKVSRWMVNRKVPLHLRDRLPLLTVNGIIAAIIFDENWFIGETFAAREGHSHSIYFRFGQFS